MCVGNTERFQEKILSKRVGRGFRKIKIANYRLIFFGSRKFVILFISINNSTRYFRITIPILFSCYFYFTDIRLHKCIANSRALRVRANKIVRDLTSVNDRKGKGKGRIILDV